MAIRAKVKKPFPYARDHINARQMQAGEVDDFPDDVFAGLEASGHLEKTSVAITAPQNPAEPEWSAMGDNELVALIRARTGKTVNAGDMSNAELVAMARAALGLTAPQPDEITPVPAAEALVAEPAKGKTAVPATGKPAKA